MSIKKSSTETGHARNLANFQAIITICTGYATAYNPSNTTLSLTALKTLATDAQKTIDAVATNLAQYSSAVAEREAAFTQLNGLSSKIVNALKANGAAPALHKNANNISKRIKGQNRTKKPTPTAGEPTEKEISNAQLSYDRKLDNLNQLLQVLKTETTYKPNENELKIDTITKLCADLSVKSNNAITKATNLANARLLRNQKLYFATGIVPIANNIKAYVKSVFGPTSPQYKQLSGIQFVSLK